MAVPMIGEDIYRQDKEDREVLLFFPLMTTSPALIHASDTYLDNAELRDVSVKSIYVESTQMDPDPEWDGSKRDWNDEVTHISSKFVDGEGEDEALNLNAGPIPLPMRDGVPDKTKIIEEIAVLRSNLSEGLLRWQEVTRIKNGSINWAYLYDYFVENGNYYRYALQPITADGRKGPITDYFDSVSTYDGFWLLGEEDKQFSFIYDGKIQSIAHNRSEAVIETISGKYPFIVSSAELDYRTFQFSGKLTYEQDVHGLLVRPTYSESISGEQTIPVNYVELAYGDESLLNKKNDLEYFGQAAELKYSMPLQRMWRNKILEWLKDGKPKILKSEAEGNILVRITDVQVTPVVTLYGLVADFTCKMTEVGDVRESTLKKFKLRKESMEKSELLKERL